MDGMIICPRCKAEQPKQPICSSCGFDIRAYALSRQSARTGPHKTGPDSPAKEILSLGRLFAEAWEAFKERVGTLLVLYLLTVVCTLILFVIPAAIGGVLAALFTGLAVPVIIISISLATSLSFTAMGWGLASVLAATVDSALDIKSALGRGKQMLWAYLWLITLASIAITGGLLLFIVPGVLLLVWAFPAQFVIFAEEERGMNALLKSREYVRGYAGDTFVKLLVIFLAMGIAGLVPFGQIVFFPFVMLYLYRMYENLRQVKGSVVYSSTFGSKFAWIGTGLIGLALPLVLILLVLLPMMKHALPEIQNALQSGTLP